MTNRYCSMQTTVRPYDRKQQGRLQEQAAGNQGGDESSRAAHLQKREVPATVVHRRWAGGVVSDRSK